MRSSMRPNAACPRLLFPDSFHEPTQKFVSLRANHYYVTLPNLLGSLGERFSGAEGKPRSEIKGRRDNQERTNSGPHRKRFEKSAGQGTKQIRSKRRALESGVCKAFDK